MKQKERKTTERCQIHDSAEGGMKWKNCKLLPMMAVAPVEVFSHELLGTGERARMVWFDARLSDDPEAWWGDDVCGTTCSRFLLRVCLRGCICKEDQARSGACRAWITPILAKWIESRRSNPVSGPKRKKDWCWVGSFEMHIPVGHDETRQVGRAGFVRCRWRRFQNGSLFEEEPMIAPPSAPWKAEEAKPV